MKLNTNCKYCGKVQVELSRAPFGTGKEIVRFACGHSEFREIIATESDDAKYIFTSCTGDKIARDYQKDAIKHFLNNNGSGICGDQMRLGKTPTALLTVKNAQDKMLPCLCLVRSANIFQWVSEIKTWFSNHKLAVFVITSANKSFIPEGFDFYVVSMDSLRVEGMLEAILELKVKAVIADEAHSFKNTDSSRSRALVNLIRAGEIDHKLFLTGTPIKNRAEEFFIMLNLVNPQKFPSMNTFRRRWLVQDGKGRWSAINPRSLDLFRKEIAPFYLRREKEDVFTDLPPMDRVFTVIEIDDPRVKAAYNKQLDLLETRVEELQQQGREISFRELQGNMMILRRICGMAKVPFAVDYLDIFLDESENAKLCVGLHHKDVRNFLRESMNARTRVMELSGSDDAWAKNKIMVDFEKPENQLLLMNMVAGGVGMDFHYCHNVLVLERMWSSADEEQFEFRFYNPDRKIMGNHTTTIEYPIAAGTVDSQFYDMVEEKRHIFGAAVGTHFDITTDPESFQELLTKTLNGRLK